MKLNHLFLLGATSLFVSTIPLASYAEKIVNPITNSHPITISQNQIAAGLSGTFVAGEAPTKGTARIVSEGGHNYLEIDAAFSTSDQGPDLHVLLDTAAKPGKSYENLGATVNLGRLRSYSGAQRYPLPDAINPAEFKSVVIWCRMANAVFGYAPLQSVSSSSN